MNRILKIVLLIVVPLKACCTKSRLSWIQDFWKMNGKRKLVDFGVGCRGGMISKMVPFL